jgi:hypothetical protein
LTAVRPVLKYWDITTTILAASSAGDNNTTSDPKPNKEADIKVNAMLTPNTSASGVMEGFTFDGDIEQDDDDLLAHCINDPVPDNYPGFEIVAGSHANLSSPELLDYLSDAPRNGVEVHKDSVVMVSSQSSVPHISLKEKVLRVLV